MRTHFDEYTGCVEFNIIFPASTFRKRSDFFPTSPTPVDSLESTYCPTDEEICSHFAEKRLLEMTDISGKGGKGGRGGGRRPSVESASISVEYWIHDPDYVPLPSGS